MIPYKKYRYIYPPRPENKTTSGELLKYEGRYIGQPKLNGSNLTVYTNGFDVILMNRHKQEMKVDIPLEVFRKLHRGSGWIAINGELMNKSKKDTTGRVFNHKFVIFDIIVYNGKQMVGKTFIERVNLINELYQSENHDNYIKKHNKDIYIVKTFTDNFLGLYEKLVDFDMYEGLVLKDKNAKLKNGVNQKNNINTQIKVRKATKNYSF
jgi:hypothetical protein